MRQAEQRDLGADQGAVGLVEVQQLQRLVIAGVFQVLADEAPRVAFQAAVFEVHGEEGEVGGDVGEAERFVEFDAVEQHHALVDDRGIAQVDVAVAFADETVRLARLEYRKQALEGGFRPGFQGVQLLQVGLLGEQRTDLLEVLPHRRHAGFRGAQRVFLGDLRRALVEIGDLLGQGVDMRRAQLAAGLDVAEQAGLGELAALQQVFDGRAVAAQHGGFFTAGDRQDFQVQAFGEALVEAQLFLAEMLARFQAGEVEEAEVHRLLDLVGIAAGEQDPGDVGFDQSETLHRVRKEGRVLQGGNQRLAHGGSLVICIGKRRIMAAGAGCANFAARRQPIDGRLVEAPTGPAAPCGAGRRRARIPPCGDVCPLWIKYV
ncbi:hypothetical protein D9M71_407790 [compost metagenome]